MRFKRRFHDGDVGGGESRPSGRNIEGFSGIAPASISQGSWPSTQCPTT